MISASFTDDGGHSSHRYPLEQLVTPSSCQRRFDADTARPRVRKCAVVSCPLKTVSKFTNGFTQPHWAHQSDSFLDVPEEWSHLSWLEWWRALTQYLFAPGPGLLRGLAATLGRTDLLRSPADPGWAGQRPEPSQQLKRAPPTEAAAAAAAAAGFGRRFASSVASWGEVRRPLIGGWVDRDHDLLSISATSTYDGGHFSQVRRPLIGVHVRLGDGCWDSKRGGCKYVKSFAHAVTRLREAGVTSGATLPSGGPTLSREPKGRRGSFL